MEFSKQLDLLHEAFIDGVFAAVEYDGLNRITHDAKVEAVLCSRHWSADAIVFWINNYHEKKAKP